MRETVLVSGASSGLDFFRQVLELRGYRQQVLTADIANASTPGFKAVDLDFRQALAAAGDASTDANATSPPSGIIMVADNARDLSPGGGGPMPLATAVKYQAGDVTLDGNSVDLGREKTAAAENAVQYEAAATFTSQVIKMLTTAIGGAPPSSGGG